MSNPIQELLNSVKNGTLTTSFPSRVRRSRNRLRAKQARNGRKFLKGYTWDAVDNVLYLNKIMENKDNIFLGVSDVEDLVSSEIMQRRVKDNKTTVQRETTVLANRSTWKQWAEVNFDGFLFVQTSSSSGLLIEEQTSNFIKFNVNSNSTEVRAFGDSKFADGIIEFVEGEFDVVTSYIEWVYGGDGHSVNVPLNRARLPVKEMYPFLGDESLEDYYDRYMDSNANILLLIGPPGTGKTTFIRGLLAHRNSSAIVTYDSAILDKDGFFARFIEDDAEVMVLEDSDAFLKSRSDGNTMMHRFLNVGDGLVTTKGKKMVFSTNLPSIRDIDSALVRPGRCFDIVTFDALNVQQANKLADKLGVTLPVRPRGKETEKYTLAEVFNQQSEQTKTATTNRKVGFI
jgi:ATPase family associated with various cellular activities (AAA)